MSKFLPFLQEFSQLSPVEQKIFLFCLEHCPHPRKYTGDIAFISSRAGIHRKSVEKALKKISALPLLRRCVAYILVKDINKEFYRLNALHNDAGELLDIDTEDRARS
jgi:hypothetical protein